MTPRDGLVYSQNYGSALAIIYHYDWQRAKSF